MEKTYKKNCPQCGNEMSYTLERSLSDSINKGTVCKSCSNRIRKISTKTKAKISESLKDKYKSNELKPNMSGAHSLESRKKMSETKKGGELSEEHKNKIKVGINKSEKFKIAIKSKERANKISKSLSGRTKSEDHKIKLSKNHSDVSGSKNPFYGKKHSVETKKKIRVKLIDRLETARVGGFQLTPFYNPKGCECFDRLMEINDIHIQHAQNGGEFHIPKLGYWVDGYDKENNVVYEYDEKHHFNPDGSYVEKDLIRENEIKEFLKCKFIRIKERLIVL